MTLTRIECEKLTARPGKFEGEPIYSPYFYEFMLDGMADKTIWHDDGTAVDLFKVEEEDIEIFPELKMVFTVAVSTDDNGFAYCQILTEDETNALLSEENL